MRQNAASFLDLSSISVAGSAGSLFIFLAVNGACYRLSNRAWSSRGVALLLGEIGLSSPRQLVVPVLILVVVFGIEGAYRGVRERRGAARRA